tara:strand:+ start:1837 stop:2997 length:1161 start_codon:yes stop_codon:yes gene_type:complete
MSNKQYVVHNNEVFEKIENDLFTSYKPVEVPQAEELSAEWHGKKIPSHIWFEILAFMKASQAKFSSETMLFLYYDENSTEPWSYWVPPQKTSGMTVKSDPDNPEFVKQRQNYPDTMFGTVHHHCTSSAFQSGTDEADETTREGFHFTVGKLGKDQESEVHARLTLAGIHYEFENLNMIIENVVNPFNPKIDLDDNMLDFLTQYNNRKLSKIPEDWQDYDFDDQLKNVTKPWVGKSTTGYRSNQKGFYWDDDAWEDKMNPVKKTNVPIHEEDLADELVQQLSYSWDFEEAVVEYYTQYESKYPEKISDFTLGNTDDDECKRVLSAMLQSETFMGSSSGKKIQQIIEDFIDEYDKLGYKITLSDISDYLTHNYENRSTIQHMVKKGLS